MAAEPIDPRRLERLVQSFDDLRILVVGDVILDEYLLGNAERVSPEAPVPVVHIEDETVVLGGAGNVARNLVALGAECRFVTVVGDDEDGRCVVDLLKELGVDASGVVRVAGRPTTRKTRVVARAQQVLRVDRETRVQIPANASREVLERLVPLGRGADAALLQDYGKGLFAPPIARRVVAALRDQGLYIALDPKGELGAFKGVSLVKPNLREAESMTGLRVDGESDLARLGKALRRKLPDSDLVITRGARGVTIFAGDAPPDHVPTPPQAVFDVQGAGDTAMATLVLALRAGGTLRESAVLANAAAGVVLEKVGTATASREELQDRIGATIGALAGADHATTSSGGS